MSSEVAVCCCQNDGFFECGVEKDSLNELLINLAGRQVKVGMLKDVNFINIPGSLLRK